MIRHEPGDLADPLLPLEELFEVHRAVEDLIQLLDIGEAFRLGERKKFRVQRLVRNKHFAGRETVEKRKRRSILDTFSDAVFVQVPLIILAAEGFEGSLAVGGLVDRRASEADESRVR